MFTMNSERYEDENFLCMLVCESSIKIIILFIFERTEEVSFSTKERWQGFVQINKLYAFKTLYPCVICENQEICQLTWAHESRKSGELKNTSSCGSKSFFAYR